MKINLLILDLQRLASLYFMEGWLQTNHFLICKIENSILVHNREILCEVHGLSLILYLIVCSLWLSGVSFN